MCTECFGPGSPFSISFLGFYFSRCVGRMLVFRFMTGPFYDAHNHLQDPLFSGQQSALLHEAKLVGVRRMVVNGTSEADWSAVAALAQAYPDVVVPSFGLHPWHAHHASVGWGAQLEGWLTSMPAAVGEIGLDRMCAERGVSLAAQEEVFKAQLTVAATRNIPASIHCVRAWDRLVPILRTHALPKCGVVMHGFTGPSSVIEELADRAVYFSCAGSFLHRGRDRQRQVCAAIPRERLLLESDAPYQSLPETFDRYSLKHPDRSARLTHPASLVQVYEELARVRGVPLETLTSTVQENFLRVFGPG